MPLLKWSDELSVGVPSLDDQHKKMLLLLNDLNEGLMSGKDRMGLGDMLNRLITATAMHIKYEEGLLARAGYSDEPVHRAEHVTLMRQFCGIRQQYETIGPNALTLPVVSFLKNGLLAHLRGADAHYRGRLRAATGIKAAG